MSTVFSDEYHIAAWVDKQETWRHNSKPDEYFYDFSLTRYPQPSTNTLEANVHNILNSKKKP